MTGAYPYTPGYKAHGTSELAAHGAAFSAADVRNEVLRAIERAGVEGLTADEAAAKVHRSILTVRPRVSELKLYGLIKDSGRTRLNDSGRRATVWIAATKPQSKADDDLGGLFACE